MHTFIKKKQNERNGIGMVGGSNRGIKSGGNSHHPNMRVLRNVPMPTIHANRRYDQQNQHIINKASTNNIKTLNTTNTALPVPPVPPGPILIDQTNAETVFCLFFCFFVFFCMFCVCVCVCDSAMKK